MQTAIVKMINDFEHGQLSRRELIAHLTGMFAASLGGPSPSPISNPDPPQRIRRTRRPLLMPPISITSH